VPFTLVYARKYVTEDKSKTDITKTKHNPEKANNTKHSKNKTSLVQSPLTTLGHDRLILSTMLPSPHGAAEGWHVCTVPCVGVRNIMSSNVLL